MSIDPTIAVLYAQTGYAARAAHDAAVAPQTAAAMSRVMAEEAARLEQQQVQQVNKGDAGRIATEDEEKQERDMPFGSRRKKRAQLLAQDGEESEDPASGPPTPLVGNLLNMKV